MTQHLVRVRKRHILNGTDYQKIHITEYDSRLPLISVIMPAYNSAGTVERAVRSVIEQSYANTELIVVDNGSADDTASLVRKLSGRYAFAMPDGGSRERIKLIVRDNTGVSAARNEGIREARGEWFMSLDADDYYEPDTIESMYRAVSTDHTDVSICGMRKVWERELKRNQDYLPEASAGSLHEFVEQAFISLYDKHLIGTHSNKLYNTRLIRERGIYYDEELAVNEDIDFVLRYLEACGSVSVVPKISLSYVQHDKGESLINTFQPHGLRGALKVLAGCSRLLDTAKASTAVIEEADRRMFVHICSFAGLMYYRSDFDRDRIRRELEEMRDNQDFDRLLKRLKAEHLKDRIARFLLDRRLIGIYDKMCRIIYRNKE